jgi:hypothetical protein
MNSSYNKIKNVLSKGKKNTTNNNMAYEIFKLVFIDKEDDQHQLSPTFSYKGKSFAYIRDNYDMYTPRELSDILMLYDLCMNYKDWGTKYKADYKHRGRVGRARIYLEDLIGNIKLDSCFAANKCPGPMELDIKSNCSCCSDSDSVCSYETPSPKPVKKKPFKPVKKTSMKGSKKGSAKKSTPPQLKEYFTQIVSNPSFADAITTVVNESSQVKADTSLTPDQQHDKYGQIFKQYMNDLTNIKNSIVPEIKMETQVVVDDKESEVVVI